MFVDASRAVGGAAGTAEPSPAADASGDAGLDPGPGVGPNPHGDSSTAEGVAAGRMSSAPEPAAAAAGGGWGWYEAGQLPALLAWLDGGSAQEAALGDAVFEAARLLLPDPLAGAPSQVRAGGRSSP